MKAKKILIFGNYGGQNWGDEMILSGLLSQLPRDRTDICVVSSDPELTRKIHAVDAVFPPPAGIRSLLRRGFFSVFSRLRSADFVIFGGGGLLQNRERKAIFLWAYYAAVARFFSSKILFVGNSIGPIDGFVSQFLARKTIEKAKFFSVRDDFSAEFLREIGQEKIAVPATDAVFALSKFSKKKIRKGTLLVFRGDGAISAAKIKSLFSALPKPIIAMASDRVDRDLAAKLGVACFFPKNLAEIKSAFASAKLVLSSRLHGGIFALLAETPFLLFCSAPKIHNFFVKRGGKEVIFPEHFSQKKVNKKISELLKSRKITSLLRKIRQEEKIKTRDLLPIFLRK